MKINYLCINFNLKNTPYFEVTYFHFNAYSATFFHFEFESYIWADNLLHI